MPETRPVLWRDPFDPNMVHFGYQWQVTKNKYSISHAGSMHLEAGADILGKTITDAINDLPQGQVFGIKMTLEIEED